MNRFWEKYTLAAIFASAGAMCQADVVANFPMEAKSLSIVETVSGNSYAITSQTTPENIPGARGNTLRFDGYSTYVAAQFAPEKVNANQMTISLWCAVETYPMMNVAEAQNVPAAFFGNIDDTAKTGFAFKLSSQGDLSFDCYVAGWKVACNSTVKLQKYSWNHLVAVIDAPSRSVALYNNGSLLASSKCMTTFAAGSPDLYIGKPKEDLFSGDFLINTFNGLIDDINIYNTALSAAEIAELSNAAENAADLSIPASRFADNILRPRFHAMPAACWTNECHGMVKYNGRYHIFFQKNANGPYMARLHWGHISSADLCTWQEEKIALAPSTDYDIKGCWSGCVFTDDVLTGGKPNIWYTAVDNARATICKATPDDENLINWTKSTDNPVINGRPSGLSDDFRDCYIFSHNGNYYMIVGTGKDGLGAATLHRYNNGSWSNDGSIFFQAPSRNIGGRFWEMPNVTKIGDKWLFTVTPLETGVGVETLYWIGDINDDGTFSPLPAYKTTPGKIELDGFSRDGFGLLSPSIMQADGKTIALGIVPDKLPGKENFNLGWAHNYSLPREWSINADNELIQKPYDGLKALRSNVAFTKTGFSLNGAQDLSPVNGRKVEMIGEFTIGGASDFGFRMFKSGENAVEVYYSPASNMLTVDMTKVARLTNDSGVFNGIYQTSLPKTFSNGDIIKMHIFIDNSILDIFINDRWASSIRVFPTDATATGIETFANGECAVKSLNAWILDENLASVDMPNVADTSSDYKRYYAQGALHLSPLNVDSVVSIYSTSGKLIYRTALAANESQVAIDIDRGLYIATIESSGKILTNKFVIH